MFEERNSYKSATIILSVLCVILLGLCFYLGYNHPTSNKSTAKASLSQIDSYLKAKDDIEEKAISKTAKEIESIKSSAYSLAVQRTKKHYPSLYSKIQLPVLPPISNYETKHQFEIKPDLNSKEDLVAELGKKALHECHQKKVEVNATKLLLIANNYSPDLIYKDLSWGEIFKYVAQEAYLGCKRGELANNANILKSCIEIQGVALATIDPALTKEEVEAYCSKESDQEPQLINNPDAIAELGSESMEPPNEIAEEANSEEINNNSDLIFIADSKDEAGNHTPEDWNKIIDFGTSSSSAPLFFEQCFYWTKKPIEIKLSAETPDNIRIDSSSEEDSPEIFLISNEAAN